MKSQDFSRKVGRFINDLHSILMLFYDFFCVFRNFIIFLSMMTWYSLFVRIWIARHLVIPLGYRGRCYRHFHSNFLLAIFSTDYDVPIWWNKHGDHIPHGKYEYSVGAVLIWAKFMMFRIRGVYGCVQIVCYSMEYELDCPCDAQDTHTNDIVGGRFCHLFCLLMSIPYASRDYWQMDSYYPQTVFSFVFFTAKAGT